MEDAPGLVQAALQDVSEPAVSPVVTVVVVAQDPGTWFEEVLTSFAAQDYPRLRFVVMEAAAPASDGKSAMPDELKARVAAVLPNAETVTTSNGGGFTEAANAAFSLPGRSQFVLLCRDDVALAPDAIRLLVEEAIRSNAALLGPKLVEWSDERRIHEVGLAIDKLGVAAPYAELGEFDQEQHDAVRDVFAVSGSVMLIRADLFDALGGFDETMEGGGFDADLCWRAHVAGARVMVVPNAVGRSGDEYFARESKPMKERALAKSQVRSLLSNYGALHSLRIVPQGMVMAAASMLAAIAGGRFGEARSIAGAWLTALAHFPSIRRRRSELAKLRTVADSEVRRFHVRGFEDINRRVRLRGESSDDGTRLSRVTNRAQSRELQAKIGVWMIVIGIVGFGSRQMFTNQVPVINQFGSFGVGPWTMLRQWFSSYRPSGLGSEGYAPTVDALIGFGGLLTFGQMGLLRTLLTVGMIILGAWGMYRLLAPFDSLVAQLAAPMVYVAVPLSYNALANGSWRALVLLGSLPWMLKWLVAAAGIAPFTPPDSWSRWVRHSLVLAVWIALAGAWVPAVVAAVGVLLLGVALGGIFTGRPGPLWRLVPTAILGVAAAFALHLPWSADVLLGEAPLAMLSDGRSQDFGVLTLSQLLRFETGPHGSVPLGWALILLAGLSLLLSRSGRLVWAVRGWMIALLSYTAAWLEQQNDLNFALPEPEVLLAPAALGIAIAASMGVLSFEHDLRRHGFGWRQTMPLVAVAALFATFLGGLGSTFNGRWETPRSGFELASLFLADSDEEAARVLWVGNADVLPVGSREFEDGLAFAVTPARTPDVRDLFVSEIGEGEADLVRALDLGIRGGTSRLGQLLGPMGIRYVVIVERAAPPYEVALSPASPRVLARFGEQLDLEETEVRVGMRVFRNAAWVPVTAALPAGAVTGPNAAESIFERSVGGDSTESWPMVSRAALNGTGLGEFSGRIAGDTEVYFGVGASENWQMRVDGEPAIRSRALGWANSFAPASGGSVSLVHETPLRHQLLLLAQVAGWCGVGIAILAGRRRND